MTFAHTLRRAAAVTAFATLASTAVSGLAFAQAVPAPNAPATATVTAPSTKLASNAGVEQVTFQLNTAPQVNAKESFEVALTTANGDSVAGTVPADASGGALTVSFDLTMHAPGWATVLIEQGPLAWTCAGQCLNVIGGTPQVTSVAPSLLGPGAGHATEGAVGETAIALEIVGSRFARGDVVEIEDAGGKTSQAFELINTSTVSLTRITTSVRVKQAASPGAAIVRVKHAGGGLVGTCTTCFTVASPIVVTGVETSVTPPTIGQGGSRTLTVRGSGFAQNMTLSVPRQDGSADSKVVVTRQSVAADGTSAVYLVQAASDAPVEARPLVLRNPDTKAVRTVTGQYAVTAKPNITSIADGTSSNAGIDGGATNVVLSVSGTYVSTSETRFEFRQGTAPYPGVTLHSYDATNRTLTVSTALVTADTDLIVRVTNPDGGTADFSGLFKVKRAPVIESVSPPSLGAGATNKTITINGSNFAPTVEVTIPGVSGTPSVNGTGTAITLSNVSVTGSPGVADVSVYNNVAGRRGRVTADDAFSIDSISVDSISPAAVQNDASYAITVNGASMAPGAATVELTRQNPVAGQPTISVPGTVNAAGTVFSGNANVLDAAPGLYLVRLTDSAGHAGSCGCTFNIVRSATPSMTLVSPATLPEGSVNRTLEITGTGFTKGTTIAFDKGVTPGALTFVNSTRLTVPVTVPASVTNNDPVTITLNVPGSAAITNNTLFKLVKAPVITGATPGTRGQGAAVQTIDFAGDFIRSGATLAISGDGLTVGTPVIAADGKKISVPVTVAPDATTGARQVTVTNPDGAMGSCGGCFTVTAKPSPVGLSPASGGQGKTSVPVTITGSNFQASPLPVVSFGPDITVTNVAVPSSNTITATLNLSAANLGAHAVTISNADGGSATCACEYVVNLVPTVTQITPATLGAGAKDETVTIKGTNFSNNATPTMPDATFAQVTRVDATTVTAKLTLTPGVTAGTRQLTVTNSDTGEAGACPACFSVTTGPTINSISPSTRGPGAPATTVHIDGSNFSGSVLELGPDLSMPSAPSVTAGRITAQIAVASGAAPGPRTISVVNSDRGRATTALTVNPAATATSVSPDKLGAGASPVLVTITGTNFSGTPVISFGPGVTITNINRSSATTITMSASAATNAERGARDISITNGDGYSLTCPNCVSIVSAPTLTGASPASRGQGAPETTVTLTGTGFDPGAVVSVPVGSGLTAGDATVVNGTTVTVPVSVASDAATGAKAITVTNPDGGSVTAAVFTVNAAPTATSLTNNSTQRGRTGRTSTVTGSNFTPGPVTASLGDGITVTNAQATSTTTVTLTYDVTGDAPLGARDVVVRNPDGGTATCASCFTVLAPRAFSITGGSATPVSGTAYAVTVTARTTDDVASPADTSYTGTPTITAPGDGSFTGTCGPAAAGVSNCSVEFGDLGPATLTAVGSGADGDLGGTAPAVVQPTGLEFVGVVPATADRGAATQFTVRPLAKSGASITDYAGTRTLQTTGGASTPAHGSVLSCSSATCAFSVTWLAGGTKTLKVVDDSAPSRSTPTATITVPFRTSLSLTSTRTSVYSGETTAFSGVLRNVDTGAPVAGGTIDIYARVAPQSVLTLARSVTTNSNGVWSTTFRIDRNAVFQAAFLGSQLYDATVSAQRNVAAKTRPVVTSPRGGSSIRYGSYLVVQGYTRPRAPNSVITLVWKKTNGQTMLLSRVRVNRDGTFRFVRGNLPRGSYNIYVSGGQTAVNAPGTSQTFSIRVV